MAKKTGKTGSKATAAVKPVDAGAAAPKKVAKKAASKAKAEAPVKSVEAAAPKKAAKRGAAKAAEAVAATAAPKKTAKAAAPKKAAKKAAKRGAKAEAAAPAKAATAKVATPAKKASKRGAKASEAAAPKKVAKAAGKAKAPSKVTKAAKTAAPKPAAAKAGVQKSGKAKNAKAPKKAAKRGAAKSDDDGPAAGAVASGESAKQVTVTSGASALADWVARFDRMVELLQADARVEVLAVWKGPRMTPGLPSEVLRKKGVQLDPAMIDLYSQANGLALVWVPTAMAGSLGVRLKKHKRPSMMELEALPPGAGVIALAPIHDALGLWGAPFMDYAQYMPGEPPHLGFDFPGNYYTPAFVIDGGRLKVKVGDDHGAAWDGPAVDFTTYMDALLATWGSVPARRAVFIRGKGKLVRPWTLDLALAEANKA